MSLIVQKFGGTSVGDIPRIEAVADKVARFRAEGHDVVVVVSAMSGETNRLIELANEAGGMDNITVQIAVLPPAEPDLETTVTALEWTDPRAAAAGPWLRWLITIVLVVGVLTLLILGGESPSPSP